MMTIEEILMKMIEYSNGNIHDINHLIKVHAFARMIAAGEGVDERTQRITEVAAIVHDIACPLCRAKYGNTNGKHQEREGVPLTKAFLADTGMEEEAINRVAYLVGHHHTIDRVDGMDYRILLEADYLVNAYESEYSIVNIMNTERVMFRTATGKRLLEQMYLRQEK